MTLAPRVVLVHRRTELTELLERHGTRGQAAFYLRTRGRRIEDVDDRHEAVTSALTAVAAAIREAENRTCGQIVCVLAHASSAYAHVPILWSSLLALFTPWPLMTRAMSFNSPGSS